MRWLSVIVLSACAGAPAARPEGDDAPKAAPSATATSAATSEVPRPDPSAVTTLGDEEQPGLPADASALTRADAEFRAARTNEAAAMFIDAFVAAKQSERTIAIKQSLDDAIAVELAAMAEMEAGWLSAIGLEGYCQRTIELRQLPATAATRAKIAAEAKRFCRESEKK